MTFGPDTYKNFFSSCFRGGAYGPYVYKALTCSEQLLYLVKLLRRCRVVEEKFMQSDFPCLKLEV